MIWKHQNVQLEFQINQNHLLFVSLPGRQTTCFNICKCEIFRQSSGHIPAVFVETEAGYLKLKHNLFSLCWILTRRRARCNKYNQEQPVFSTTELPPALISWRCLNKFSGATFLGVTEHYKIHISIHEFGELRVSGPPNLYIFEPLRGDWSLRGNPHRRGERTGCTRRGEGHRVLPEDLFLSNEERRWQLLTLCSQRTKDEVRSSISSFFFFSFSFSDGKTSATERLVTACLLFIINQYAFKPAWPGDWGLSWANSKHFACALFLTFKTIWKWKWIPIRAAGSIRPFWFS